MYRGISLTLNGFTPKLDELARSLLAEISDESDSLWTQTLEQSLIDVCKEKTLRGMKSCKKFKLLLVFTAIFVRTILYCMYVCVYVCYSVELIKELLIIGRV